jgi:hypothetical protein
VRGYRRSSESSISRTPSTFPDHLIVPNADDAIAESGQIVIALSIWYAFRVLTAVDLEDDVPVTAREVSVIFPNRFLAGELEAAELPIAKIRPELPFRRCKGTPQGPCSIYAAFVLTAHAPHPGPLPASGARELLRHLVLGQVFEDAHQAGMIPALAA